jgi:hypothetical protein
MKRFASPVSVMVACGLIVVTNLAILAAAGWNRRGEPLAEFSLTEREVAMPEARQDDGAGFELKLITTDRAPGILRRTARWKHYELPAVNYDWLDRDKLLELGFRIDLDPTHPDAAEHYVHEMTRRVYIVVEYDGEAWRQWIGSREEHVRQLGRDVEAGTAESSALADAEAVLAIDQTMRSRLFPVDAGVDAEVLRRRYADSRDHAIVAALLRPIVVQHEDGVPTLSAEVMGLVVSRMYVSREFRRHLEEFLSDETWQELETRERREAENGWPSATPPRYRATLAVGLRHEPWLVSVTTLDSIKESRGILGRETFSFVDLVP